MKLPHSNDASRHDLDSADLPDETVWEPSETEIVQLARSLLYVRPLDRYPGWRFDADWENPDLAFRMRRRIWSYCRDRQWDLPVEIPWYDGLRIKLHLSNDLSKQLFIAGCIEPNEFALLDKVLGPGMTFIDAGANEGIYTLFASRRVGATGQVWSFEPSAREFQRLQSNVELNQLSNVRLYRLALAGHNGTSELLIADPEHAGHNTLGDFAYADVQALRSEKIGVRRLDDLAEEECLSRVDVLKIDVEGAEVRLLEGGREVLRSLRPILLLEASEDSLLLQGGSTKQLLELLISVDYSLYAFDRETGLPVPAQAEKFSNNVVAVPLGKILPEPKHPAVP